MHLFVPVCVHPWCCSQTRAQEGLALGRETSEDLKISTGLKIQFGWAGGKQNAYLQIEL